jgi:hypothetical protein
VYPSELEDSLLDLRSSKRHLTLGGKRFIMDRPLEAVLGSGGEWHDSALRF